MTLTIMRKSASLTFTTIKWMFIVIMIVSAVYVMSLVSSGLYPQAMTTSSGTTYMLVDYSDTTVESGELIMYYDHEAKHNNIGFVESVNEDTITIEDTTNRNITVEKTEIEGTVKYYINS